MKIENVQILLKSAMVMDKDMQTQKPLPEDKIMTYGNMELFDKTNDTFVSAKFSYAGRLDKPIGKIYNVDIDAKLGNYPEETKKIRHKILSFVDKK